jgi:hypothetical protein
MSDGWAGTVPDMDEIARLDTGVPHIDGIAARPVSAWCAVAGKP